MRKVREIDVALMKSRFEYDPINGNLIRKPVRPTKDQDPGQVARWNGRFAGKVAGWTRQRKDGYRYISVRVNGKDWAGHRVCWAVMTGEQPPPSIDHENGDGTDNRWINLKAGHGGLNERNQALQKNNTSGVCGVTWNKVTGKWYTRITVNRQHIALGSYERLDDARAARLQAEKEHGFSPRHGKQKREVANHG